jgi:hypothetical protein
MVTEPSCETYLSLGSGQHAGVAIKQGEAKKFRIWNNRNPPAGVVIVPLVMESSGRIGGHFKKFLKVVMEAVKEHNGDAMSAQPYTKVIDIVRQLSVTMQKGNVAIIDEAIEKATKNTAWRGHQRQVVGPGWE